MARDATFLAAAPGVPARLRDRVRTAYFLTAVERGDTELGGAELGGNATDGADRHLRTAARRPIHARRLRAADHDRARWAVAGSPAPEWDEALAAAEPVLESVTIGP
jgi:hypothetical protein